jgi:HSP20 family molecular chaperone IbpA
VQQKREVEKEQETVPERLFLPTADIFETDRALTVVLEIPGVNKENVDVSVDNSVLKIDSKIDFSKYQGVRRAIRNKTSAITQEAFRFRARSTRTTSARR